LEKLLDFEDKCLEFYQDDRYLSRKDSEGQTILEAVVNKIEEDQSLEFLSISQRPKEIEDP
jgi:hypothetical protein